MMAEPHSQNRHTAHTLNHVPFVLYSKQLYTLKVTHQGCLADIAPTILQIMGIPCPHDMTGTPLTEV